MKSKQYDTGQTGIRCHLKNFDLLHGGGDEDSGLSTIGRAGYILDNLLAARNAKPMIIVMPNGSMPRPEFIPGAPPTPASQQAQRETQQKFVDELLNNVIPNVEKNYRVLATRENRAIAGLSMGLASASPTRDEYPMPLLLWRKHSL